MKKIFFTITFFLFFSIYSVSFSFNQAELKLYYDKFYLKLEKNNSNDNVLKNLEKLDKNIKVLIIKSKDNTKIKTLNFLLNLNTAKISLLKSNISKKATYSNLLFINELKKSGYKYLEVDDNLEFNNNGIYRFDFTKYFNIDNKNYKYFIDNFLKDGYIIKYKGDFLITNDYKIEKKYLYSELKNIFKNYFDVENPYFINSGIYYTYKYQNYLFFDNVSGVYLSDLKTNNIDINNTLLIKNKSDYYFVNNFTKIRLVGEKIIQNIANKNDFLGNLTDDNKFFINDSDNNIQDIKNATLSLINGLKTNDEKIKIIYSWIVDNISYYENFRDGNKQVFSGILTYKNKIGVCDGYTKLFFYMLSFAGINDFEIKRGFAFDNNDFPNYGHAWVRISDKYYDPTFDDPIGGNSGNEFNYFALPSELIYVNRFDGLEIPDELKKMSLQDRKKLVMKNMYYLYEKYKDYNVMKSIKNKVVLGLNYDEDITIDKLKEKLPFYEVNNFSYFDGLSKKQIKKLNYYTIDNNNIENIILNPKIDIKNAVFFKWNDKNGNTDYRLAYDLITY